MSLLCELRNVTKRFGKEPDLTITALEKIDLPIREGEIIAVIGPSGCGKSTLLRILAGLETPSSGTVFYEGSEKKGLLPDTSMVFQSFALYPWMTVRQNIRLVLEPLSLCEKEKEHRVASILKRVGLEGFEHAYPKEISGGMKQRVGLARALVRNPKILLLDEPFSALDAFTAENLRSEVIHLWQQKTGKLCSIVMISHDIEEVVYMADTIIVLGGPPGHITLTLQNPLPRPREYRSPAFLDLVDRIHATYGNNTYRENTNRQYSSALLPTGPDQITGLLQYLSRKKGPSDLSDIAKQTKQHLDKILVIAKAAEMLGFVEVTKFSVLLTEIGESYLQALPQEKARIWEKQLIALAPVSLLYTTMVRSPSRDLTEQEILRILAEEFPEEDPGMQMHLIFRWDRPSRVFRRDRKNSRVVLSKHPVESIRFD